MTEHILIGFAGIAVLGFAAQWLAWRFRFPSVLLLLLFGFVVGPVTGFLNPDELLGDLLFPAVSVSVAIILFEGGLGLKIEELREVGRAVRNLITVGVLITWLLSAAAAYLILGMDLALALLFGGILVVTGPTVIIPLLRYIRPTGRVGQITKWEGIVNDPIGAVLAVLVFQAILAGSVQEGASQAVGGLVKTILIGGLIGIPLALLMALLLRRHWVPGFLQNGTLLTTVVAAFVVSNFLQPESGLLTVTVMGIILANQKGVTIRHIVEFKENLRVLLISGLFIILTARLQLAQLAHLNWRSVAFLIILIVLIRPATVLVSTIKSRLNWSEKLFLAWMAPRGIVAAAVTSIFALELAEKAGYAQAEYMVPEMFLIIAGTVTIYSLTAARVGCWLGVAQPNPQGALIVGAHPWARAIARALYQEGIRVLLVDTNRANIRAARLDGLPTSYASILSEYMENEIDIGGLGRLLALTPNDEVNSLAAIHFIDTFDRTEVYQLAPRQVDRKRKETVATPLHGRILFAPDATYAHLAERFEAGAIIKKTDLTEKFTFNHFQKLYGERAVPLFFIDELGNLTILTPDNPVTPRRRQTLVTLVNPTEEISSPE
ncbi:MAG: sodium:proton antiporter [Anaerolineae bacterium]|nr:sodium:proton antiporter [Anaerolineae bacterium]